jgi:hypothetical protein
MQDPTRFGLAAAAPPHRQESLLSWEGFEDYREQVRAAARDFAHLYAQSRAQRRLFAFKVMGPMAANPPRSEGSFAPQAADALRRLTDLNALLVQGHNLDCDLVRREWAPILDANPAVAAQCDRILADTAALRRAPSEADAMVVV